MARFRVSMKVKDLAFGFAVRSLSLPDGEVKDDD